ncbi:unnamed protein product [Caenorhabditis auriculariae]|uniref:Uncharacterized protein n=1 Tax=Caenorhabditis auriculariae TaxID=2777116 RepID=A0A8S1HIK7_9PELO|nr:unnamed protein product [Caenorhabditis auriculariae]
MGPKPNRKEEGKPPESADDEVTKTTTTMRNTEARERAKRGGSIPRGVVEKSRRGRQWGKGGDADEGGRREEGFSQANHAKDAGISRRADGGKKKKIFRGEGQIFSVYTLATELEP